MAGAVIVVLSLAGANFAPATIAGYILAAGMLLGYAGLLYGMVAFATGAIMIALALRVRAERHGYNASKQLFAFSILYLFLLFVMLLVDRMSGGLFSLFAA